MTFSSFISLSFITLTPSHFLSLALAFSFIRNKKKTQGSVSRETKCSDIQLYLLTYALTHASLFDCTYIFLVQKRKKASDSVEEDESDESNSDNESDMLESMSDNDSDSDIDPALSVLLNATHDQLIAVKHLADFRVA